MFSKFFIQRPIFATVLAILMILAGLITVKLLPVAQYPDITPPTIFVSASYPGADAQTVAETVGVPIEEQVNGVEGMMYMSSSSGNDGSYSLQITFENGTDLDMAAVKVQNRVSEAEPQLPSAVKQQGVSVQGRSSNIILFLALESDVPDRYDGLYLTNYAQLSIVDELSRIDGVGGVSAFGSGEYSMRVWLDPEKMRVRGITPSDVSAAISSQNIEVSAGSVGAPPADTGTQFEFTLTSAGRLKDAEEFENIVVRTNADGGILRLKDIARVDMGSQSYSMISNVSGRDAGLIGVYQLPGANAMKVASAVKKRMEELKEYFPEGVNYKIILDTTDFVSASIDEVLVTFLETTLIVMLVILLFLQNWRAVVIPMITIPVSLIATFAVMKLMGFTLNTLTLFGLVLAIAIVVDDAIVVVEDVARILSKGGCTPTQAAEKAMDELSGPVVGEVLVLLSVFIPTAFISGITGELYKQFALTIAVSTAFSGFNALTFTPAMCALFLRPKSRKPTFFIYRWFNTVFEKIRNFYNGTVGHMLRKPVLSFLVFVAFCALAFWGFFRWPTSYVPQEDMGYFMTSVQLPTGASIERTDSVMKEVEGKVLSLPQVKDVISVTGNSFLGGGASSNLGSMFVILKPWKERKGSANDVESVIARVSEITASVQDAVVFSVNPPAIPGLGVSSGLQMQILDVNNLGSKEMAQAVSEIQRAAAEYPELKEVTSLYQAANPQYNVKINRDRAKLYGLTLESIYSTLSSFMGTNYVNDFVKFGRTYEVLISGSALSRSQADDVLKLSVRNDKGDMVPFAAFASVEETLGQANVNRYNMYSTASVNAVLAPHVSSSNGIKAMEEIMEKAIGPSFSYAWTGEALQETESGTSISMALIFAVIITILVLAAQYESWTDPLAVVITTPTAILGTVLGCILLGQSISIYTQIGIILLLGMAAKNAILIVEYATDYRKSGMPVRQAAESAGNVRLRPILMTALAFVFGVMPMLFATGAGAGSRLSLGTAVVFGMAVNAVLGTLFVPNFWELFENIREKYLSKMFAGSDVVVPPSKDSDNSGADI
ncbi:MAG: multidrug efflux RND transporter permease subunit [Muribaculaceae bacterium]|jgi:hydrophobe/amphiphile efflux-1 (HAE1) family protein|nr:multidrug efflux RND transporter permease subunit [Muribaculaceae bacterium]